MRTNEPRRQGWSAATCTLALLALTIGTALAAVPSTTAYRFSSHPMISGTVVTVNDHQMVVDTDQGEQVTLEVDSRTMAPRDLAPGMVMRTEFLALEDCRFYAQRIMPIRGGMSTHRLQAYANTANGHEAMAHQTMKHDPMAHGATMHDAAAVRGHHGESMGPRANVESRESRPQTMGEHSPGTMMTASPTTADYQFSTRPMVSGEVISVNDHRLVVETDQGQQVGLVMDSRTMVPGEVAPGTVMRAEFMQMKDGRYYARRISRIESGVAGREQAYAHTRDSDVVIARNVPDCGFVSAASPSTVTSSVERRGVTATPEPVVAQSAPEPEAEPETLPQTASQQPLILLLGWFALGSAGLVTVLRGFRIV